MALAGAGWDKKQLQRESQNIGHFVGIDKDDWMYIGGQVSDVSGGFGASAAANSITSNRFSYSLNLKGASMTIDTACSSSLVCLHVSKLHLRNQDFDPMPACIVNGCNLMLSVGPFIGCCGANMLSHEGRCFTFNDTADGYARGELCSAIAIRRKPYTEGGMACVAGTQANQDGRSASMTAPNGPAQERCIQAVLRETGLSPAEIDCLECHGTGTALGDPIEVGSVRKVMASAPRTEPAIVTSSKSNIGHGEGGAGLAGFIKCCEQVMHTEGCSNVHLRTLNPHLDVEGFPCHMLTEKILMREDSAYNGVSSFGFGGTNGHGEAWGKNIETSRGCGQQDAYSAFNKKLRLAPPAEITMNGDDVEDWETTGMPAVIEQGVKYQVLLDEDGIATWEEVHEEEPDYGDEFYVIGTHNEWEPDALDRHPSINGLWTGSITLSATGEECVQIQADADRMKTYHPTMRATLKSTEIKGPEEVSQDFCWVIRGSPGETLEVEWFQQGKTMSINWMRR